MKNTFKKAQKFLGFLGLLQNGANLCKFCCIISVQIFIKEVKTNAHFQNTNKTIRFPVDIIEGVEKALKGKNCTFTGFVIAAVRSALEEQELN